MRQDRKEHGNARVKMRAMRKKVKEPPKEVDKAEQGVQKGDKTKTPTRDGGRGKKKLSKVEEKDERITRIWTLNSDHREAAPD